MIVILEIEDGEKGLREIELDSPNGEVELAALLAPVAEKEEFPLDELLLDVGVGDVPFDPHSRVVECLKHGNRWRHRRVCVDLHFESEEAKHSFPVRATWAQVHHWGCHGFDVPRDACANLELRDGAPNGPVLNDRNRIGYHHGCKTVWLVRPGPEPYGKR